METGMLFFVPLGSGQNLACDARAEYGLAAIAGLVMIFGLGLKFVRKGWAGKIAATAVQHCALARAKKPDSDPDPRSPSRLHNGSHRRQHHDPTC